RGQDRDRVEPLGGSPQEIQAILPQGANDPDGREGRGDDVHPAEIASVVEPPARSARGDGRPACQATGQPLAVGAEGSWSASAPRSRTRPASPAVARVGYPQLAPLLRHGGAGTADQPGNLTVGQRAQQRHVKPAGEGLSHPCLLPFTWLPSLS